MKHTHFISRTLSVLAIALASTAASATDVGVSVSVGQPGFYGRINIGNYPQPVVVYPEPIVIRHSPVVYEPIYLRVPPGHAKNWGRYCGRYSACGRPVYFVQDSWYNDVYAPRYREEHGRGRDRDDFHHDHEDHGNHGDHDRGHGNGHGRGHDRD